jgi:peptidoglycan-associated lipoprotein
METTPTAKAPKDSEWTPSSSLAPVYFDLDKAVLRTDARKQLKARAKTIKKQPEWGTVTIEGHCDERGSEEYNLALGERRASAVKRFLMDSGVPASRLETVTYGESRPAARGHTETAWRHNRRSEFTTEASQSANR